MSQVPGYFEWYRDGPLGAAPQAHRRLVPQEDRVIQAGPIHIINVSAPSGGVVEPAVPEYGLHLLIDAPPLICVGFNRAPRWLAVSPGSLILAPPDTAAEYLNDGPVHALSLAIPKAHVDELREVSGARVGIRQEEAFRDPRLVHQLVQLWHALADEGPGGALLADQAMRTVLEALARRTDARAGVAPRRSREHLAAHTLRRLRDYVETRLADELDVMTLADVAALSPAHFARAFAATVGMTPFHYVMTRRLARARELLERTRRPALDIALDVGFKTPSHFTSRFRREFGLTPRAIRGSAQRSFVHLELQDRQDCGDGHSTRM